MPETDKNINKKILVQKNEKKYGKVEGKKWKNMLYNSN
jgi:hypothetical protein